MRHLINKAIESLPNLDNRQMQNLISILAEEVQEIELLEMVLSSIPAGVIVARPDHCIQFVNIPARRHLPMAKEYEDKLVWEAILDRDIANFVQESLKDMAKIEPRDFTIETLTRDMTLSVTVMPVVKQGAIQGDFVFIEDVTDKRAEEARLRRAESLASLTTLAAGVAHEIKNPLGSISIHLQLMQKMLGCDQDACKDDMKEYLGIISEEVDRLNSIVVDYLFAVRPMDTSPVLSNLNTLIDDLINFMQFELKEGGIELISQLDETLPEILLDDKLIKQTLLNIVKNAMAAMPEGGTLTIRTFMKDDRVQLRISDTGKGIPKESVSKIFEPYFTTKDNGSGLGLTLVYKVIKEHGGEISVNSRLNKGTHFTINFPVPQMVKKLLAWEGDT